MRVRYTSRARDDLRDIVGYLDEHSPMAAKAVRGVIERSIALPADFALMARASDIASVRELTIARYPYKIYYAVEAEEIWILHIRDARRRPWSEEHR